MGKIGDRKAQNECLFTRAPLEILEFHVFSGWFETNIKPLDYDHCCPSFMFLSKKKKKEYKIIDSHSRSDLKVRIHSFGGYSSERKFRVKRKISPIHLTQAGVLNFALNQEAVEKFSR